MKRVKNLQISDIYSKLNKRLTALHCINISNHYWLVRNFHLSLSYEFSATSCSSLALFGLMSSLLCAQGCLHYNVHNSNQWLQIHRKNPKTKHQVKILCVVSKISIRFNSIQFNQKPKRCLILTKNETTSSVSLNYLYLYQYIWLKSVVSKHFLL